VALRLGNDVKRVQVACVSIRIEIEGAWLLRPWEIEEQNECQLEIDSWSRLTMNNFVDGCVANAASSL
jgi:hypothetical protein